MALIEINTTPSHRDLLWFGAILTSFILLIAALLFWRFHLAVAAISLFLIAAVICLLYYLIHPIRRPIYLAWMYGAFPIGWTVSHLLLAAVYFLAFLPIGLITRLLRYDPLRRRLEPTALTYWTRRNASPRPASYFRQF